MTNAKIKDLEYLVNALKKQQQLKEFKKHLNDSFDMLSSDYATNESIDEFYTSDFTITFRGVSVSVPNGAEVYNDIELIVDNEIEETTEWIETLIQRF